MALNEELKHLYRAIDAGTIIGSLQKVINSSDRIEQLFLPYYQCGELSEQFRILVKLINDFYNKYTAYKKLSEYTNCAAKDYLTSLECELESLYNRIMSIAKSIKSICKNFVTDGVAIYKSVEKLLPKDYQGLKDIYAFIAAVRAADLRYEDKRAVLWLPYR